MKDPDEPVKIVQTVELRCPSCGSALWETPDDSYITWECFGCHAVVATCSMDREVIDEETQA